MVLIIVKKLQNVEASKRLLTQVGVQCKPNQVAQIIRPTIASLYWSRTFPKRAIAFSNVESRHSEPLLRLRTIRITIIIIIIIIAEMTVFNVAGYRIEERHGWPAITASPRGQHSK